MLINTLKVEVHRNGKIYHQEYERGVPIYDVKEVGATDKTGTIVTFLPDNEIFHETVYHFDILQSRLRELSFLNKGIKLSLTDKTSKR